MTPRGSLLPETVKTPADKRKHKGILTEQELQRLRAAIESSERKFQKFRDHGKDALEQYFGSRYGDHGTEDTVPINMMYFTTEVFTASLAAGTPQALVSSEARAHRNSAYDLELALNYTSRYLKLGHVINEAVFNSLYYGVGIIKTGCSAAIRRPIRGFHPETGQPFAEVVHPDEFIPDMEARSWRDVEFMVNRYRIPLEDARSNPTFDAKLRKELKAKPITHRQETGEVKASDFSRGGTWESEEFEENVELMDVWLPRRDLLVTLATEGEFFPLREHRWSGPENGPFRVLVLSRPSGQLIPVAKAWAWMDLHILINDLYCKAAEQAINQKTIGVSGSSSARDARKFYNAKDGDWITVDDPRGVNQATFGGADNGTLMMAMQAKQLFNQLFGNPEVLAGVGPQSDTFGQDNLISGAATRMVDRMGEMVLELAEGVEQDLAYYITTDPLIHLPLEKVLPETHIKVPFVYTADRFSGNLIDHTIRVEPYSLQRLTPQQRLRILNDVVMNVIIPGAGMLQQSGASFDFEEYLRTYGRYAGISADVSRLVRFNTLTRQEMGMSEEPRMAPVTTRNHVRHNKPGPGPSSEDAIIAALANGMQRGGNRGTRTG